MQIGGFLRFEREIWEASLVKAATEKNGLEIGESFPRPIIEV